MLWFHVVTKWQSWRSSQFSLHQQWRQRWRTWLRLSQCCFYWTQWVKVQRQVVNEVNGPLPSRVFATHTPGMMSDFRADPVTRELISVRTGCFLLYTLKSPHPASGLAPVPSDFYIFIWNVLMGTTEPFLFPPTWTFLPAALYSLFVCAFIKTVVYLEPK